MLAAGIVSAGGLGLVALQGTAFAESGDSGSSDSLSSKIASKFGLDEGEVENVVSEFRNERQQERIAHFSEYLDTKVADGTITEAQKQLIIEKRAEMRAEREGKKGTDMTREERRQQRETNRAAIEQWAEENGIPLELLHDHDRGEPHRGFGQRTL